jgi:hypothetical protein
MVNIRLDKTRPYSTAHGDRQPEDPHYNVHFVQDGLPFDASGELVADDGKKEPWIALMETGEGKTVPIKHWPLYSEEMRKKVERKLARLNKTVPKQFFNTDDEEEDETAVPVKPEDNVDDINLVMWLMGQAKYEAWEISKAYKKRFGKVSHSVPEIIADLIWDEKIVDEKQVDPRLLRMVPQFSAV